MFCFHEFSHAVMVIGGEGSWQAGRMTSRAARCLFCRCSPLFPRNPWVVQTEWCLPRGYLVSERKQADRALATRIARCKIFILQKGPRSSRLVLFQWRLQWSRREPNLHSEEEFWEIWFLLLLSPGIVGKNEGGGGLSSHLLLHARKKTGIRKMIFWHLRMVFTTNIKIYSHLLAYLCVY